jgi:hypothetical protein
MGTVMKKIEPLEPLVEELINIKVRASDLRLYKAAKFIDNVLEFNRTGSGKIMLEGWIEDLRKQKETTAFINGDL